MPNKTSNNSTKHIQNKIYQESINYTIDFYNLHEKAFKTFEKEMGFDLWFLNHARTYYKYRNHNLKINELETKKSNKQNSLKINKAINVLKEIFLIFAKFRFYKKKNINDYLLISNYTEIVNGENKRFKNLVFEFGNLYNRFLFSPNHKVKSRDFAPKKTLNSDSILLIYLLNINFIPNLLKFRKNINRLQKSISENNDPQNTLINIMFWDNKNTFFLYHTRYMAFYNYFKKNKHKGILMTDENSPQQKVIQYAAKKNKIKVFAFQHGNIFSLHPAYMYGKYNTKPVLPDITFTWGKYFTQLLYNQGGYNHSQIFTSGRISPQKEYLNLNPIIKNNKKILLYISQPQRDPEIRLKLMTDVMLVAKEFEEKFTLIVRPHPREKDDIFFNLAADKTNFHNFIIDRTSNLHSHMHVSDILIVAFSTVGIEYIKYNKPMLVLDYLKLDLMGWIKEKVGIPIQNIEDLKRILSQSEIFVDIDAHKTFVENYYITDQNVSKRIREKILND